MKMNVVRRIASSLFFLVVAVSTLQAQGKIPTWVKKEPVRKDSYIGIAQIAKPNPMDTIPYNPFYKEDAQRAALWKIASQMPWNIDVQSSLYAVLSGKGLYQSSLNDVLLAEIQRSPLFVMVEEWENETEYWCYFSAKKLDAQAFITQLVENTIARGERMYGEAKKLQNDGYLYKAALKYIETLDSLHPAIFRSLPVIENEEAAELGQLVYQSYLDVYKGITMTTEIKGMPAVYGEEIPGKYSILIMQNNVPLRNLGVIPEFEGVVSATPITDEEGRCYFSIDNISSHAKEQTIGFVIDTEYLMELPSVYGCNPLQGRHLFPSLKIPVSLFNPNVYTKINTASTDSLLKVNLNNIWKSNREDVVFTERFDSADVVVDITVDVAKEADINTGKYQFVQYKSALVITVKGVADDVVLADYKIDDFRIMLPASRTMAQVRQAALREMIRQVNRELPEKVKGFNFDKRELVWRQLASISKED